MSAQCISIFFGRFVVQSELKVMNEKNIYIYVFMKLLLYDMEVLLGTFKQRFLLLCFSNSGRR